MSATARKTITSAPTAAIPAAPDTQQLQDNARLRALCTLPPIRGTTATALTVTTLHEPDEDEARRAEALSRFGSEKALFEPTQAEAFCIAALAGLDWRQWAHDDFACVCNRRFAEQVEMLPNTLSDCLHEARYWYQLYALRRAFGAVENCQEAGAREDFVFALMATIPPRSTEEGLDALEFLLREVDHDTFGLDDATVQCILRNLVAGPR